MKAKIKVVVSALGIGTAVLLLAGCHHFGGGCSYAPAAAPVATATVPANTPTAVNSRPQVNASDTVGSRSGKILGYR